MQGRIYQQLELLVAQYLQCASSSSIVGQHNLKVPLEKQFVVQMV